MPYTLIPDLASRADIPEAGTLSRVLHNDDRVRLVLFAFDAGQELTEHTANAVGNAHGGVLCSLADVAFASGCNSEGILSVAIEFSIQYLAPHPSAGVLFARGEKSGETRKLGFYRLEVTAEDGTVVAQGQAVAYKVGTRKPE